jgi:DNA replicative helicase MCM subunit Mcm2 (Cdc46/Mcm family)
MENENKKKYNYNPEKAHQYYLNHLNKNNEKIKCSECGVSYQYYSKSRHLKSKTHLNAVKHNEDIKKIQNQQPVEVFKLKELSDEQIKKMQDLIKKPEVIDAFINLIIDAYHNELPK